MHLCHDSKEKLWGESEWWVCNNNRYLSDSAGVCGGKKIRGMESPRRTRETNIYDVPHRSHQTLQSGKKWNPSRCRDKMQRVCMTRWNWELREGEREANNHKLHVRQLHRLPGSFMSQLRCALWRVFKGRRMHLMRPAWCDVHVFAQI